MLHILGRKLDFIQSKNKLLPDEQFYDDELQHCLVEDKLNVGTSKKKKKNVIKEVKSYSFTAKAHY